MNNINDVIKLVLNFLVIGIIIYIVARLFIFLLPVILVLIVIYYVYRIYRETRNKVKNTIYNVDIMHALC